MGSPRTWARVVAAGWPRPVRWVAGAVLWLGLPGYGQSATDGAIAGVVLGTAGRPLVGAEVVAREQATGVVEHAVSGKSGEFLLVRLPVGEYTVSVRAGGGALLREDSVTVRLGDVTEISVRLAAVPRGLAGGAGGMVQGVAAGETTATSAHEQPLTLLPVNGGEWKTLALESPNAGAAAGSDDGAAEVSFRGNAVTQNSSRTEGLGADESFGGVRAGAGIEEDSEAGADVVYDRSAGVGSGGKSVADGGRRAGAAYTFAQAAVREFRVDGQGVAAAYGSALYGHGVGGVVTTVSREGGTALHGMGFYTVRDSAWASANPFSVASSYVDGVVTSAVVKPEDLRQQFGGRVGGPVQWDWAKRMLGARGGAAQGSREASRLFYFYAFDEQRRSFPAVSAPGYPGFYALTPTQTALLGTRGVTPAKTMAALNYLDSLTGTVARRADQTVNFGRVDWHGDRLGRVVFEYNRARWSNPAGARTGQVVDRGVASLGSSFGKVDAGVGRWIVSAHEGLTNEVRVQYGRELQYETAQTPLAQEPNVGPGGLPPEVSIGPEGLVFGTPAALGQRAYPDERRFEIAEVAGWVRGRHFVQAGMDFSALSDYTDSLSNVEGTFSYDSGVTGGKAGGLVDWITDYTFNVNAYPNGGCPSIVAAVHNFCFRSYSQSFGQQSLGFGTQEWAGFVQDDWRAKPTLTVHAGLRYEYQLLPLPQTPNAGLDVVFGAVGATSVYPEDRNNFGPRIGVAWQPLGLGRGVVRVGYGLYFGKLPGATVRAALLDTAMASSATRVRILTATETLCPQKSTVGFGYACSYLAQPAGVVAATTSAVVFDRRFRLPEVQEGTLAVEHGLGWGVLGTAEYTVNLDRQLPNSVDVNIAPATGVRTFQLQGGSGAVGVRDGETFVLPAYTARVSPSFGPVTDMVSNANATFHGMTLEARRGLGGREGFGAGQSGAARLAFRVAWTWSKAIDFGQNAGAVPRTNGQLDPFTVRYDKGLSAMNFPHRVVGTVLWTPRLTGRGLGLGAVGERGVRDALNGWSVAGIFRETSGRGYSYDIFGGTRLAGGHESLNGSGGSVVLPTVGRNTLRLPDTWNVDMRLSRSFRMGRLAGGEGVRLRADVEAFNVANNVNYSGVQQRAFLAGTAVSGVTPVVYQDAAAIATEGLNVLPFGAYTAAGTGEARERQVQLGLRLEF